MKKILLLIMGLFLPISVLATETIEYNFDTMDLEQWKYDYIISKYDIDIKVNSNNSFDITENIEATFNKEKHGIIRSIPLTNEVERLDGTKHKNRAIITKLSVNEQYERYRENGNYKIKIGDEDKTIKGIHNYTIKYNYNIGKDPLDEKDEFYFNIIGDEWDTIIKNITFKITMPDKFDTTKLGFSHGNRGSTTNENIVYEVDENVITGHYLGYLPKYNAITVRCELEEGYFKDAGFKASKYSFLLFIIPFIFVIISISLWHKYGKDEDIVKTVEFYPPNNLNSLEVGYIYKGKATNQDITSLLIYLANKGYIKIATSGKKGFKITKLKEYDGDNEYESIFLNGLFKNSSKTKNGEVVTDKDLYNKFYLTMNRILNKINSSKNKNTIYEKSASNKIIYVILMIIASILIITIPPFVSLGMQDYLPQAFVYPIIIFVMIFIMTRTNRPFKSLYLKIASIILGIIFGLIFSLNIIVVVIPILLEVKVYCFSYIFGMICIIIMIICAMYLPKRTSYSNTLLGKILGFKDFLVTAEKEKLETLVNENPTYFYDILPYTYVLDVSNKWIKQFESISMQAPDWYDSNTTFDIIVFNRFVNNTLKSANTTMSSTPQSTSSGGYSGGGFSGGGFSGGGSGGGGGSSW